MARVKRGVTAHHRHKRLLDDAEGRTGTNSRLIRRAHESALHAMAYATRDRKARKRQMRRLWIIRINAAARELNYRPNFFARTLRKKRTYTVGVIAEEIGDPYCSMLISGIEWALRQPFCFLGPYHKSPERFVGILAHFTVPFPQQIICVYVCLCIANIVRHNSSDGGMPFFALSFQNLGDPCINLGFPF